MKFYKIRNFREEDLYACVKIIENALGKTDAKNAKKDFLEGLHPKINEYVYLKRVVATKDKKIIGIAGVYRLATQPAELVGICWYAVDSEYQKKGVGTALMQKMEKISEKSHSKIFFVWATKEAVPFYEKFKFKINKKIKLKPVESKILMTKSICPGNK